MPRNNIRVRVCRDCGRYFQGGPRAWYCPDCRLNRRIDSDERRRHKGRPDRPLGSIDKCEICGKEYIVNSARQRYCLDCKPDKYKAVRAEQSIDYYRRNRDEVNQTRMERRNRRVCAWCGKAFTAKTKRCTCSDECARLWRNKRNREYVARRAEKNVQKD